jgi:hypothetical protein
MKVFRGNDLRQKKWIERRGVTIYSNTHMNQCTFILFPHVIIVKISSLSLYLSSKCKNGNNLRQTPDREEGWRGREGVSSLADGWWVVWTGTD